MTTMVVTLYVYVIDEKDPLLIFVVSIDSSLIVLSCAFRFRLRSYSICSIVRLR